MKRVAATLLLLATLTLVGGCIKGDADAHGGSAKVTAQPINFASILAEYGWSNITLDAHTPSVGITKIHGCEIRLHLTRINPITFVIYDINGRSPSDWPQAEEQINALGATPSAKDFAQLLSQLNNSDAIPPC